MEPIEARPFELVNPATETPFATVSLGSARDVDRAVQAARAAFPAFSSTSKAERIALLKRIVEVFAAREDDMMAAACEQAGVPLSAVSHVKGSLESFKQAALTLQNYEFESWMGKHIIRRERSACAG